MNNQSLLLILASIICSGFFASLVCLMFVTIPPAQNNVVMAMVGVLGAAFTGVVSYFFGSSQSSAVKSEQMAAIAKGNGK